MFPSPFTVSVEPVRRNTMRSTCFTTCRAYSFWRFSSFFQTHFSPIRSGSALTRRNTISTRRIKITRIIPHLILFVSIPVQYIKKEVQKQVIRTSFLEIWISVQTINRWQTTAAQSPDGSDHSHWSDNRYNPRGTYPDPAKMPRTDTLP